MSRGIVCPRCGQDWLLDVRLVFLDEEVVLCLECDAMWLATEPVDRTTFRDYGTYMLERGRTKPDRAEEIEIRGRWMGKPVTPS